MRLRNVWVGALGVALLASLAGCGGGGSTSEDSDIPSGAGGAQTSGSGPRVDAATAGGLRGAVALNGTVPKNEPIKMNADPVCLKVAKGTPTQETFVVSADGKSMANVFVYVKDGLGSFSYDPPAGSATLNQEGCHYTPHVFGLRVGQPL